MSFDYETIQKDNESERNIQRIYIDPEHLISLKSIRKPFKMVPSVYQPPQEKYQQQFFSPQVSPSLKNRSLKNSQYKSQHLHSPQKDVSLQQNLQNLQQLLNSQYINPNVEYIWRLLPSGSKKQIIQLQQGDCIPLNQKSDRFLILEGQINIVGMNGHNYKMKQGYLFFSNNQTKNKIHEIIVLCSTKVLRISNNLYNNYLKKYVFLKNAQKIKFIQYCPFFIWKKQLIQDLASCMQMKEIDREQVVYYANSNPDALYFVKQGIVLLQRNTEVLSPVVKSYQQHYQKSQITQKDVILVVRKGMVFGLDGIIIKDNIEQSMINNNSISKILQAQNQQSKQILSKQYQKDSNNFNAQFSKSLLKRKNKRIYTAKTLGKCQLYVLSKQVLQTLFNASDINYDMNFKHNQISQKQLQKISSEYTNMLLGSQNQKISRISLKKKDLMLQSKQLISQNKRNSTQLQNKNSVNPFIKYKKSVNNYQKRQKSHSMKEIFINQSKEQIQMRNRIKLLRQKQLSLKVKKKKSLSTNQLLQKPIIRKSQSYNSILPRIQRQHQSNIPKKEEKNFNKTKIQNIIYQKIKDQIVQKPHFQENSLLLKKNTNNIQIFNKQSEKNSLKLKQSNYIQKKEPKNIQFFKIKSYKSIVSLYQRKN